MMGVRIKIGVMLALMVASFGACKGQGERSPQASEIKAKSKSEMIQKLAKGGEKFRPLLERRAQQDKILGELKSNDLPPAALKAENSEPNSGTTTLQRGSSSAPQPASVNSNPFASTANPNTTKSLASSATGLPASSATSGSSNSNSFLGTNNAPTSLQANSGSASPPVTVGVSSEVPSTRSLVSGSSGSLSSSGGFASSASTPPTTLTTSPRVNTASTAPVPAASAPTLTSLEPATQQFALRQTAPLVTTSTLQTPTLTASTQTSGTTSLARTITPTQNTTTTTTFALTSTPTTSAPAPSQPLISVPQLPSAETPTLRVNTSLAPTDVTSTQTAPSLPKIEPAPTQPLNFVIKPPETDPAPVSKTTEPTSETKDPEAEPEKTTSTTTAKTADGGDTEEVGTTSQALVLQPQSDKIGDEGTNVRIAALSPSFDIGSAGPGEGLLAVKVKGLAMVDAKVQEDPSQSGFVNVKGRMVDCGGSTFPDDLTGSYLTIVDREKQHFIDAEIKAGNVFEFSWKPTPGSYDRTTERAVNWAFYLSPPRDPSIPINPMFPPGQPRECITGDGNCFPREAFDTMKVVHAVTSSADYSCSGNGERTLDVAVPLDSTVNAVTALSSPTLTEKLNVLTTVDDCSSQISNLDPNCWVKSTLDFTAQKLFVLP